MFPFIADDPLLMIDVEDDFEDLEGNTPEGKVRTNGDQVDDLEDREGNTPEG